MPAHNTRLVLAAPHVINVHENGGSSVPLILVVAVVTPIVAGVFLWFTTARTLKTQRQSQAEALDAETKRLELTLQTEWTRLREQLSFQRGETDRAELRSILDALASDLGELERAAQSIAVGMQLALRAERIGPASTPPDRLAFRERISNQTKEISRLGLKARRKIERLELRLGEDAAEMAAFAEAIVRAALRIRMLVLGLPDTATREANQLRVRIYNDRRKFKDGALRFTEARLHVLPPDVGFRPSSPQASEPQPGSPAAE